MAAGVRHRLEAGRRRVPLRHSSTLLPAFLPSHTIQEAAVEVGLFRQVGQRHHGAVAGDDRVDAS